MLHLIYFGETEREKSGSAWPEDWAGHRGNAVLFRHDHVATPREYENRHCSEALAAINAQLKASGRTGRSPGRIPQPRDQGDLGVAASRARPGT